MSAQSPSDFLKYRGTVFQRFILPIIPAGAALDEDSSVSPENLGKIPGSWSRRRRRWYGFPGWTTHVTREVDLERWQAWQDPDQAGCDIAIGARLGAVIGGDCDTDSPEVVTLFEICMAIMWGEPVAIREREGSPRVMWFYLAQPKTMPITKMRIAFTLPETGDKVHLFEILGHGQQAVLEGPHAKGAMQRWRDGKGLVEAEKEKRDIQNPVTVETARELIAFMRDQVLRRGGTIVTEKAGGKRAGHDEQYEITSPLSPHRAKDLNLLKRAIEAIDINHESLTTYDAWLPLYLAICAACGKNEEFYHDVVLPWLVGLADNTPEKMWDKWQSFKYSTLGARYVYGVAALFGFTEGTDEEAVDLCAASPLPPPGDEDGAGAVGGGMQSASGPLPARFSDLSLAENFIAQRGKEWRYIPEKTWGWVHYQGGVWVGDATAFGTIARFCGEEGAWYRTHGGKEGPKIDLHLRSASTHVNVERILRGSAGVVARLEDFDTEGWLLNTPGGIIDLRTLEMRPHNGELMLQQTKVTPDFTAACPRWLEYLDFITEGDPAHITLLHRHGSSNFVGVRSDKFIFFMQGITNAGKSVYTKVIHGLAGEYTTLATAICFIRQREKRTFEIAQFRGKRGIFSDELPDGATWDEVLMCTYVGGTGVRAEAKFRDFATFQPVGSLTILSNHEPKFVTSADLSGIRSRLGEMLYERDITKVYGDDPSFAEKLIAAEGPAILAWFLRDVPRGYKSLEAGRGFLDGAQAPAMANAAEYWLRKNRYAELIKEFLIQEPGAHIRRSTLRALQLELGKNQQWWGHGPVEPIDTLDRGMALLGYPKVLESSNAKVDAHVWIFRGLRERKPGEEPRDFQPVLPSAKIVKMGRSGTLSDGNGSHTNSLKRHNKDR